MAFTRNPKVILLLAFVVPAAIIAYVTRNLGWLLAVPIGILALLILLAFVFGTLERLFGIGRRKCTAEEFADALEKHLEGTEGPWDWDDATGVVLADPRLERVRMRLGPNLDSLKSDEDKKELRAVIAALRRGDFP